MILTEDVPKRIFQIFFVFLFLSIQSTFRESIILGYQAMPLKWEDDIFSLAQIAFSLTHVIMQIPAGMKAEQYGAKIVMQLSMLFCAIISLVTPLTIILNTKLGFIFFASLQGLGQGCFIPTFYVFTSQWVSLQERSILFSAGFGGIHFGSAVGIPIIKRLSDTAWFAGYVLSAFLGFTWVLSSIFFMRMWRPRKRLSMTSRHNLHLLFGKIEVSERGVKLRIPWRKIFTSLPFWSTMFAHFGTVWINGVFLRDSMVYLKNVYNITLNSIILARPHILSLVMIFIYGAGIEILRQLNVKRSCRRKIMSSLDIWGSCSILYLLAIPKHRSLKTDYVLLLIGAAFSSGSYSGVYLNHAELSPVFAGTLMGISNVVANLAPAIKPIFQENLLVNEKSKDHWSIYFGSTATIMFFTNLPFVLYGTSNEQLWYNPEEWPEEGVLDTEMATVPKGKQINESEMHSQISLPIKSQKSNYESDAIPTTV